MVYFLFKYRYKGPSLLDAVDSVKSQDLRYRTTTLSTSYVINGYAIGTPIRKIMEPCTSLERGSQGCTIARAGDNVAIALQENDANQVMSGVFCGNPKEMDQTDLRGECIIFLYWKLGK
ncbi:hypothetical protein YC2023_002688 [Brassica napus]